MSPVLGEGRGRIRELGSNSTTIMEHYPWQTILFKTFIHEISSKPAEFVRYCRESQQVENF